MRDSRNNADDDNIARGKKCAVKHVYPVLGQVRNVDIELSKHELKQSVKRNANNTDSHEVSNIEFKH